MLTTVLFFIVGLILFKFLFWRRLKDDYDVKVIFSSSFYLLFGSCLGALVSLLYFPRWWFWLTFLGMILGLSISYLQHEFKLFEVFEAWVVSSLSAFFITFLHNAVVSKSNLSVFGAVIILILLILFGVVDKQYKNFSWYKSGRVGFTGLSIFGIFFIMRASVAIVGYDMLSFVGASETMMSAVLAFASFLALFHLSKKVT